MSSARRTIPKLPTPAVVTFEYEIGVSRPDSRQRASTEKTVSGSAPRQLLHRALREAWVRGSERTNVVCTREDRPRNGCAARSWHRLSSRRLRRGGEARIDQNFDLYPHRQLGFLGSSSARDAPTTSLTSTGGRSNF